MTHRRRISLLAPNLIGGLALGCAFLVTPAHAALMLTCTHITKSTLEQEPLARPFFATGDEATVEFGEDDALTVWVNQEPVAATLRLCPRGTPCGDTRPIAGDVVTFYTGVIGGPRPLTGIWHRKGGKLLIENVVMRCCLGRSQC